MPLDWREIIESALMHVSNVLKRRRPRRVRRQPANVIVDGGGHVVGTVVPARAKPSFPFQFRILPVATLEMLAMDRRLVELDRRLLMLLVLELAGRGWTPLKQDVIASRLGCSQPSVSRSMSRLARITANGVPLLERQTRGNSVTGAASWRLNLHVAWMGTVVNWYVAERSRRTVSETPDRDGVLPDREEP